MANIYTFILVQPDIPPQVVFFRAEKLEDVLSEITRQNADGRARNFVLARHDEERKLLESLNIKIEEEKPKPTMENLADLLRDNGYRVTKPKPPTLETV